LTGIVLLLPACWTRLFEGKGLEVAGGDRLAVVPPDL